MQSDRFLSEFFTSADKLYRGMSVHGRVLAHARLQEELEKRAAESRKKQPANYKEINVMAQVVLAVSIILSIVTGIIVFIVPLFSITMWSLTGFIVWFWKRGTKKLIRKYNGKYKMLLSAGEYGKRLKLTLTSDIIPEQLTSSFEEEIDPNMTPVPLAWAIAFDRSILIRRFHSFQKNGLLSGTQEKAS